MFLLNTLQKKEFVEKKNEYLRSIALNIDYIEENFTGLLDKTRFLSLIKKSHNDKGLQKILYQFVPFADINSIDDAVFNAIWEYPNQKIRKTLLIELGHCRISFFQLLQINSLKFSPEAFAQLLHTLLTNSSFSCNDLNYFLKRNLWIRKNTFLQILKNIFILPNIEESKKMVLNFWIKYTETIVIKQNKTLSE